MKKTIWYLLALVVVTAMALAACQPAATPTTEAPQPTAAVDTAATEDAMHAAETAAAEEEAMHAAETESAMHAAETEAAAAITPIATLRIWADNTRAPVLVELADDFKAAYNVELVIEELGFGDIRTQMITAAPVGEGPDVFIGAHDWLGSLTESGLVAPIDLGDKQDEFVEESLAGFTYTDGQLYGVPYATETLGFFYNTDLVSDVPTTWDGVLEVGRELKADGTVDYAMALAGVTYDALPIQTSFGGYVFGQDAEGNWNTNDVGIDSEGMIAAVAWMADAVEEGLIPDTSDWDTAHSLFETGRAPFLMAGPWALDRIRASGVPYAVTVFPDDGAPFLGVQGFMVNAFSENVLLAQAFLTEFVATDDFMQKLFDAGKRPSAFKSVLERTEDADLAGMAEAGANATLMPYVPEMGSVWGAWQSGVTLGLTGEQTPEAAMTDAATQIRNLILGALAGMVNLPGDYQSEAGCATDWDPACLDTAMEQGDDGLYRLTVQLPAGEYGYKVAHDGSWTVNYGSDGAQDGPNYALSLAADSTVTFTYDPDTHLVEVATQ